MPKFYRPPNLHSNNDPTLQELFSKYATEILQFGPAAEIATAPDLNLAYSNDPWAGSAVKFAKDWLADRGVAWWITTDPRIHLLIDLQAIARGPTSLAQERIFNLIEEYGLDTST